MSRGDKCKTCKWLHNFNYPCFACRDRKKDPMEPSSILIDEQRSFYEPIIYDTSKQKETIRKEGEQTE